MRSRFIQKLSAVMLAIVLTASFGSCSSSSKPSKEALIQSLAKELGNDGELAKKVVSCLVDEIYDKLSPEGLNAIAKSDKSYKGTDADNKALGEAMKKCSDAALK